MSNTEQGMSKGHIIRDTRYASLNTAQQKMMFFELILNIFAKLAVERLIAEKK